jgi:hypothetical protein
MATAQAVQATPEQIQAAQNIIAEQVLLPEFFDKLASYGYVPRNEAQRCTYINIGVKLMRAHSEARSRPPTKGDEILVQAKDSLDETLRQYFPDSVLDGHSKQASAQRLAADPQLLEAALALTE